MISSSLQSNPRQCVLLSFLTIEGAARLKGLQRDDLQGGPRHGRLDRQMPACADGGRIELAGAEAAHLLDKCPSEHCKRSSCVFWASFSGHPVACHVERLGALICSKCQAQCK